MKLKPRCNGAKARNYRTKAKANLKIETTELKPKVLELKPKASELKRYT